MLWQIWWVWIVAGIVLGVLEVVIPGFVLLGFAIGAALTGLGIWLGLIGGSLAVLVLVWAVISAVAWAVLRRMAGVRRGQVKIWDRDINED